jgi:hypothetical protein
LPPDERKQVLESGQSRSRHSLQYLHNHWTLPDSFDNAQSGGGIRGKVISLFGRLTYRVLGPYFHEEREVIAHLVRVSDALEKRCDELTLRCERLSEDMLERQAAEAANLTKLALWLHLDPPSSVASVVADAGGSERDATSSR